MPKTIFQRIIDREIPATIEHEDEHCIVIRDIEPKAPVHLLIIPKQTIVRISESSAADEAVLGHLLVVAKLVAKKLQLSPGFRLVINNGPQAGEAVAHLHATASSATSPPTATARRTPAPSRTSSSAPRISTARSSAPYRSRPRSSPPSPSCSAPKSPCTSTRFS